MSALAAYLRPFALLIGVSAVLGAAGGLLSVTAGFSFLSGLWVFGAAAIAACLLALYRADRYLLRMHSAQKLAKDTHPQLYSKVTTLARAAGIPAPSVYVMPTAQPNAYAVGRTPEKGVVVLTEGLLRRLGGGHSVSHELVGVISHELAHIKRRDTLLMPLVAAIADVLSKAAEAVKDVAETFGSSWLGGLINVVAAGLVSLAGTLLHMAVSRDAEYRADLLGAEICGQPLWLAEALERIDASAEPNPSAEAHPSSAALFIINPLSERSMRQLFSSHPKTADRVARLRALHAAARAP